MAYCTSLRTNNVHKPETGRAEHVCFGASGVRHRSLIGFCPIAIRSFMRTRKKRNIRQALMMMMMSTKMLQQIRSSFVRTCAVHMVKSCDDSSQRNVHRYCAVCVSRAQPKCICDESSQLQPFSAQLFLFVAELTATLSSFVARLLHAQQMHKMCIVHVERSGHWQLPSV